MALLCRTKVRSVVGRNTGNLERMLLVISIPGQYWSECMRGKGNHPSPQPRLNKLADLMQMMVMCEVASSNLEGHCYRAYNHS